MNNISDALGLAPIEEEPKEVSVLSDNDFEFARENIKKIIELGEKSMQELALLSEQSQHPKAYEVLSIHIKTMIEANKELLNLRKVNQEITGNVNNNTLNTSTNIGTVFVGSTSDLQKMMADIKAKTIDG